MDEVKKDQEKKEEEKPAPQPEQPPEQPKQRQLQLRKVELRLTFEDGRKESSESPELFVVGQTPHPVSNPDGTMLVQGLYKVYAPMIAEWQSRLAEVLTMLERLGQSDGKPIPGLTRTVMPMPQGGGPNGPQGPARGSR